MTKQVLVVEDFSDGLNRLVVPLDTPPGQASDVDNFSSRLAPALAVRAGRGRFATLGGAGTLLAPYLTAAGRYELIVGYAATVAKHDGVTLTVLDTGFSGRVWSWAMWPDRDELYITNQVDGLRMYDGTTLAAAAGAPPAGDIVVLHKNRLWVAGITATRATARFCGLNAPADWASTGPSGAGFIAFNTPDGSPITALVSGSTLGVFKPAHVIEVAGDSPEEPGLPFNRLDRLVGRGTSSRQGAVMIGNTIYWVERGGLYEYLWGGEPVNVSLAANTLFAEIDTNRYTEAVLIASGDGRYLYVSLPCWTAWRTLVYDRFKRSWWEWKAFGFRAALLWHRPL